MSNLIPEDVRAALQRRRDDYTAPPVAMPPAFYNDQALASLEHTHLFHEGWVCVGRADEIPERGDFYVTELLEESLIVVRGKGDAVRVLSNVCRHRSSLLLAESGKTNRIVCPYHNWSYRLDGSLLKAPQMDSQPGFDPSTCGLPSFNVELWYGWIFVNLSGTAEPLVPQLADIDPWVHGYHDEEKRTIKAGPDYWPVNWKCLAENFMEAYHLTPVHLNTLHPVTPTRLARKVAGGSVWTAYESRYDDTFVGRAPHHPDMTDAQKRMSMMVWIYPSFVAAISPNSSVYMALSPTGVNEVQSRWGVTGRDALFEQGIEQQYHQFAASFNAEDKARLIQLQHGLHSRYATPGPLAGEDLEGCSWDFFGYVAGRLLER